MAESKDSGSATVETLGPVQDTSPISGEKLPAEVRDGDVLVGQKLWWRRVNGQWVKQEMRAVLLVDPDYGQSCGDPLCDGCCDHGSGEVH